MTVGRHHVEAECASRGQSVYQMPVHLNAGSHTVMVKAIDQPILLDQWMLDYDVERQFYIFPVKPAL